MANLLESGSNWLVSRLLELASQRVVYRRGDSEIEVSAIAGQTLLRLDDGFGSVRVEWTDRDFLIPAADLVLGGSATLPEPGDRIVETHDGKTRVYEVLSIGGEPPWRWSDKFYRLLRIRTKLVEET